MSLEREVGQERGTASRRGGVRLAPVLAVAAALALAACSSQTPYRSDEAMQLPPPPPPVQQQPQVPDQPRIEVQLNGADAAAVRAKLSAARVGRGYQVVSDTPTRLVVQKMLPPDEALKRTNNATSNAAFRLEYTFRTQLQTVFVNLDAFLVVDPGGQAEVRPLTISAQDAEPLRQEIIAAQ